MISHIDRPYRFEGLSPGDVDPGTSILVAGRSHGAARSLSLRLAAPDAGEALLVVTTDRPGPRLVDWCESATGPIDRDWVGIVDCVGDEDGQGERIESVSTPADLTGIGMRYSSLYQQFHTENHERVRTLVHSLSTLLTFGDLHNVARFVHTMTSRVATVDGLGVFVVDPSVHDEREVDTLARFCDGRIDVRETDDQSQFRIRGLPDQPQGWTAFDAD